MATIKSYTDIEQSKKLAEILPIESADACWTNHMFGSLLSSWRIESAPPQEYKSLLDRFVVKGYLIEPAWSLAALMKIIEIDKSEICFDCYGEKYRLNVHYQTLGSFCQDNELYESKIDALFAMIIKLHKRNLL